VAPGIRIVVLGKQGAGKGTQCDRISHHYVVAHVSTGDMFRAEVKSGTPLGLKAKKLMDAGDLVPDELVMEMVANRLSQDDTRLRGFVLDGFPRTIKQAEMLAELLAPRDIDGAIDLEVPRSVVLKRLEGRRVCTDCGQNYHVTKPPKVNWTCDICGGEVVQREDDTTEAIERRLDLYEHETAPLIDFYEKKGQLVKVSGVGNPDVVTNRLIKVIDKMLGSGSSALGSGGSGPRGDGIS
jgi:adenylate kinase